MGKFYGWVWKIKAENNILSFQRFGGQKKESCVIVKMFISITEAQFSS